MSKRALAIVLVTLLLGAGSALAESDPEVRPADATESTSVVPASFFQPVFLQNPLPSEEPEPVDVCREAERDICNCNDDADCDARCGEGKCHCLIALDCSEYPCVGSCRPLSATPVPVDSFDNR